MKKVEQVLEHELAKGKTPGIAYIHFSADSILHSYYGGWADVLNRKKVTAQTMFNGFSVTKTVTAMAVLQLQEKGLLRLDDAAGKYLPGFPYGGEVTIRHLLTHTAGIPNPIPLKWTHLVSEHNTLDTDSFFAGIFAKYSTLRSAPGQKMFYSNLGYILLGQIIEHVTGEQYEHYVTKNILHKVAGANELSFTIHSALHAKGYQKRYSLMNLLLGVLIDKKKFMGKSEGSWKPFEFNYINGVAYGGFIITAQGMVKYGQAILNGSLLSPGSRQQYFTEYILAGGGHSGMSLSWFTGMLKGQPYYHHAGGGGGYYIEFRLYPGTDCGSILICNRSGMKDERLLDKLDVHLL